MKLFTIKKGVFSAFICTLVIMVSASLKISGTFSDNMVLQRDKTVAGDGMRGNG